jgi:hypothetical protein
LLPWFNSVGECFMQGLYIFDCVYVCMLTCAKSYHIDVEYTCAAPEKSVID